MKFNESLKVDKHMLQFVRGGKRVATFRVNKSKNYTTINNTGLRDERLSWKAKGRLADIL